MVVFVEGVIPAMQAYSLKQCELSKNMDNALAKMPEARNPPIQVGQKRTAVENVASPAKRVRRSPGHSSRTQLRPRSMFTVGVQSQSQKSSPGVSVSNYFVSKIEVLKCTHDNIVCTDNNPTMSFAGHHWLQCSENILLDTI